MKGEQHYNDSAFDYFVLLVLSAITLPVTYVFAKNRLKNSEDSTPRCLCRDCQKRYDEAKEKARKTPSPVLVIKGVILVLLWIFLLYFAYSVATRSETPEGGYFDPYPVLGLEPGATPDEIKKAYKQLSLQHHPDKAPDPSDPDVQNRYMTIVKAYETLTDDAIREKWEKYGNPDGPRPMSVGIALPSWLVKKDNTYVVLGVYLALLVVGLPAVVGCWWRSWKKYDNTSKVMNSTMGLYYHTLEPTARFKNVIETIAASEEYSKTPLRQTDEQLERVAKWLPDAHAFTRKPKFTAAYAVKTHLLLYAQICRKQSELKKSHQADLEAALLKIRPLAGGMITICTAREYFVPILETIQMLQSLTQCCWKEHTLMQLPHFNGFMESEAESKRYNAGDIASFAALPAEKRTELYTKHALDGAQVQDVERVLGYMPTHVGFDFRCEVEGEASGIIVCKAIVTFFFTITLDGPIDTGKEVTVNVNENKYSNPGKSKKNKNKGKEKKKLRNNDNNNNNNSSSNNNSGNKPDNKDKDNKKSKDDKDEGKSSGDDSSDEEEDIVAKPAPKKKEVEKVTRLVHAPFFPGTREECWWVVIGDPRATINNVINVGRLAGIVKVGDLDQEGRAEGKVRFMAPPNEGTYTFVAHLMCDGYLGCDKKVEFRIRVQRDEVAERAEKEHRERQARKAEKKKQKQPNGTGAAQQQHQHHDGDDDDDSSDGLSDDSDEDVSDEE